MTGSLDFLRSFDAMALPALADAGLADTGTYRSPDGDSTPVGYFFDHVTLADLGDAGTRAMVRERQIGLQLSEVTPVENGLVIGDDGRRWRLVAPTGESDDNLSWWFVAPARGDGA